MKAVRPVRPQFHRLTHRRLTQLIAFGICITLTIQASARIRPARRHAPIDDDYVSALAAANHFLQAWQMRDQETAVLLLTNGAKRNCSEEKLDAFFSADPQAAYEIARGRKVQKGRYAFPVTIFETSARANGRPARPRYTELIVSRTGQSDWAIDKLP